MESSLLLLAFLGFAAVVVRCVRTALDAVRQGVDAFLARDVAETRARRGDITGWEEAEGWAIRARRARHRAVAGTIFWLVLLVAPPLLLRSPVPLYAGYSVFWLLRGHGNGGRQNSRPGDELTR